MTVVNLRDFPGKGMKRDLPSDVVRVDRMSPWGNPYRIGDPLDVKAPEGGSIFTSHATRDQVITAYDWYVEARLKVEPRWLEPLRNKRMACWCSPLPCHADVLAGYLAKTALVADLPKD